MKLLNRSADRPLIPWGTDGLPTYRQVTYWCTIGAIPEPPRAGWGIGHWRHWSDDDLRRLRIVRRACDKLADHGFKGIPAPVVTRLWEASATPDLHSLSIELYP